MAGFFFCCCCCFFVLLLLFFMLQVFFFAVFFSFYYILFLSHIMDNQQRDSKDGIASNKGASNENPQHMFSWRNNKILIVLDENRTLYRAILMELAVWSGWVVTMYRITTRLLGRLSPLSGYSIVHILPPETDNCPSWISGRERMTVHDQSPRKNVADLGGGWTRDLLVISRTAHPTEPPRPAIRMGGNHVQNHYSITRRGFSEYQQKVTRGHGSLLAHLSVTDTHADTQILCNIFPILSLQLMKESFFEYYFVGKMKNVFLILCCCFSTIYGHDSKWSVTIWINSKSYFKRRINMKFGENWPSGFRREIV